MCKGVKITDNYKKYKFLVENFKKILKNYNF